MEVPETESRAAQLKRGRRRPLSAAVFAVLLLGVMLTATIVQRVVEDQEQRLLEGQARAAGTLVNSFASSTTPTLSILGVLSQPGEGDPATVAAIISGLGADSGAFGAALREGDDFVVTSSAGGELPAVGDTLTGVRAALAKRATATDGLVSDVMNDGDQHRVLFALASPLNKDVVAYSDLVLSATAFVNTDADTPFKELSGALYAGDRIDPNRIVLQTTLDLPISGNPVVRRTVQVGTESWLLVVKARHPLVGDLAKNLPWLVLASGALASMLVGALLEATSRRRTYAVEQVEERTRELREALAEQERLEDGQRLARVAAEDANRSKSEFLSRMSHELRTPLNAVLGFAQLLETEDLDEDGRDSVEQILRGGRHLLDLINEVLDITRIETGNFQLSPEPVVVSEVVDDVLELTRPLAAQANILLVASANLGCDVHVLADRQRLKQILLNLVANAIKYNRSGGTVAVFCEAVEPSGLRIKVHDTGPGIRPEHLDLLFMPFERLGAEHTAVEGTGVGLALSRRLAEAMGGTLDVETAIGQGSTFWVQLPVVEGQVSRLERLEAHHVDSPPTSPQRAKVLYIEDNLSNVRLVQRVLDRHPDIELITTTQGRLGVDLAREHQPALVLLDLHLPDIGGDEVLRQMRDEPATSSIPVVVLSADATAGQIQRLLAEGARSYLTKPIDVRKLNELIDDVVNTRA